MRWTFVPANLMKFSVNRRVLLVSVLSLCLTVIIIKGTFRLLGNGFRQSFPSRNIKVFKSVYHQPMRRPDPRKNPSSVLSRPSSLEYVHQSWKSAKSPPLLKDMSLSWKSCFPNATHILWSDIDNRKFIHKYYEWFLEQYDVLPLDIDQAYAARYIYMFHFGGLYTDLQNECLRPFDHLLLNNSIVLGSIEVIPKRKDLKTGSKKERHGDGIRNYVLNSFMYSVPRHHFWLDVLHLIFTNERHHSKGDYAGNRLLGEAVELYRRKNPKSKDITVYSPKLFNPFGWESDMNKKCKNYYRLSTEELKECLRFFKQTSYVVQYPAQNEVDGNSV